MAGIRLAEIFSDWTYLLKGASGTALLGPKSNPEGERIRFAAIEDILLGRLKPALDPFLGHIGCDLSWITPAARIEQLTVLLLRSESSGACCG